MNPEPFKVFLSALDPHVKPRRYRRSGGVYRRHEGEVLAYVWLQRSSSSTKADPWFYVNYGVAVWDLLEDFEQKGRGAIHGHIQERLSDEQRQNRIFSLRTYPSLAHAVQTIADYLTPALDELDRLRTARDVLAVLDVRPEPSRTVLRLRRYVAERS